MSTLAHTQIGECCCCWFVFRGKLDIEIASCEQSAQCSFMVRSDPNYLAPTHTHLGRIIGAHIFHFSPLAPAVAASALLCCVFWFTNTHTNTPAWALWRLGLSGSPLPGALICCFTRFLSTLLSPCRLRHFCIISYEFTYFMDDFDFFSTFQSCL